MTNQITSLTVNKYGIQAFDMHRNIHLGNKNMVTKNRTHIIACDNTMACH